MLVQRSSGGRPPPRRTSTTAWTARADWSHHTGIAEIKITKSDGARSSNKSKLKAQPPVLKPVLESLPSKVDVVGHRIVHGGPLYRESTPLTPEVRAAIAREVEFAPAHNSFELEAIEAVDRVIGTRRPSDRGVRHRLSCHIGTRRLCLSRARMRGSSKASGATDFTASAINTAAHRAAAMLGRDAAISEIDHLPSRKWRVARGRARRKERRHHHGLHAARRPHDGHALRLHRSGNSGLPDPPSWIRAPSNSIAS